MVDLHWMTVHRMAWYQMVLCWMVVKMENQNWYKEAWPEKVEVPLGQDYSHPGVAVSAS